jgi:hypothetical protein
MLADPGQSFARPVCRRLSVNGTPHTYTASLPGGCPLLAAAGAAELGWFYAELGACPGGAAGQAQFVSCSMSRLIGK